jgi:unsaturated rhamnogalacturonyl hydrolase
MHIWILVGAFLLSGCWSRAQTSPQVVGVVRAAAKFGASRQWPLDYWDYTTFYIGLMEAYHLVRDPEFRELCREKSAGRNWKLTWRQRNHYGYGSAPGQVMLDLFMLDPSPANEFMIADSRRYWERDLAGVADKTYVAAYTYHAVDPLFSEPPLLAMLGAARNDPRWFSLCSALFFASFRKFYRPDDALCVRDETYIPGRIFWSRGNGWVIGAFARVLHHLPSYDRNRSEFVRYLTIMLHRIKALQRSDGLWSMDLTRETSPTETSGSAFFVYGLASAINAGLVSAEEFKPATLRGWSALVGKMNPDGSLGCVQPPGKEPVALAPGAEEFQPYAQGAFLMAGAQVAKMLAAGEVTSGNPAPPSR